MSLRTLATAIALIVLAACAATPPDPRIAQLEQQLAALSSQPEL